MFRLRLYLFMDDTLPNNIHFDCIMFSGNNKILVCLVKKN